MSDQETLLTFPCDFPIKAMGRTNAGLVELLAGIVREHDPCFDETRMQVKPSRAGNYVSVTLRVRAVSKAQLDAIYRAITACEQVLFAL